MTSSSAPNPPNAYSQLPTVEEWTSCRPPFSFYFDLVHKYWKTSNSNLMPLHRICTLARKQGSNSIIVESAHAEHSVCCEIESLDGAFGGGGAAEATRITFVKADPSKTSVEQLLGSEIIGQLTLINYRKPGEPDFSKSYIYEAILRPPKVSNGAGQDHLLLNNFICNEAEFDIVCHDRKFTISGVYYCQQNSVTHVCAHACLRMALNTVKKDKSRVDSGEINSSLAIADPGAGLTLGNISEYVNQSGLGRAFITDCSALTPDQYLSVISSHIQSGHFTLLVFTTGSPEGQPPVEHVVSVFGYTQNSDEWHPQAIPAYSGPSSALYRQSSLWTDHFVIHDDNFGPYYTLSVRALEVDPNVKARWIIGVVPEAIRLNSVAAEALTSIFLANVLPSIRTMGDGQWFDYITQGSYKFVLRPTLISKTAYIEHLLATKAHDGTKIQSSEVSHLDQLPELFWMVEYSLPALYTGNHSKLGEVIIDANLPINPADPSGSLLYMRFPSLMFICKGSHAGIHKYGMSSHLPLYSVVSNSNRW